MADFSDLSFDAGIPDGRFIGMTFSGEVESVKSWCTAAQQIVLTYDGTKLYGGHAVFGSCRVSGGKGMGVCRIDVFKGFISEWPTEPSFEFLPEWPSVREVLGSFRAFATRP